MMLLNKSYHRDNDDDDEEHHPTDLLYDQPKNYCWLFPFRSGNHYTTAIKKQKNNNNSNLWKVTHKNTHIHTLLHTHLRKHMVLFFAFFVFCWLKISQE